MVVKPDISRIILSPRKIQAGVFLSRAYKPNNLSGYFFIPAAHFFLALVFLPCYTIPCRKRIGLPFCLT